MITLVLDEKRLESIVGLVTAAGSRLGDARIMMEAADLVLWLESQIKSSQRSPTPSNVDLMDAAE